MRYRISRFLFVSLLIAAHAFPVAAQRTRRKASKHRAPAATPAPTPPESLTVQDQLDRWFQQAQRTAPGEWGIAVGDQQGRLLWGIQPTRLMVPASTVKLLTTGFARSIVGADARRSTRVVGNGQIDPATGTWAGTWALEINGDPTLEWRGAGPRLSDLARQRRAKGIKRLVGPLEVQSAAGSPDAAFPSTWSVRHKGRLFAPLIGNLTIHENVVGFAVAPGRKVGAPLTLVNVEPEGLERLVRVTAKTVSGRRSRIRVDVESDGRYVIGGTLGIRSGTRWLSRTASDPKAVLEAAWGAALADAGIEWQPSSGVSSGGAHGRTLLAEVKSAVFDSIASDVNRRSLNLGAELMLRWAAGGDPNAAEKLTAHVQQVTGEVTGVHLVDGSGLSSENRVSPWTFVSYLARFPAAPGGRNFPQLLPANGSGTLWRLRSGFPGQGVVRAKTGTLGNVASLVGYLGRQDGVLLVSLMYNGNRVWAARQAQWALFRELGATGVVIPADSLDSDHLGGDATSKDEQQ
jgi:D-alanyl-D-alanine carboxypeptidase/D-alanyl-D-alanine-endopeptidase (penicillin-binding protein 4)